MRVKLDTRFQSVLTDHVNHSNVYMVFCSGVNFCFPVFQVL